MKSDKAGKVILVVVEDLSRRAMEEAETPNMDILVKAGAMGFASRVGTHSSGAFPLCGILTSREISGFPDSDEINPLTGTTGSIVNLAHRKGRSTAGYFYRSRFHNLFHLYGPFDHPSSQPAVQPGSFRERSGTAAIAAREIVSVRPDFCLIYFACQEHVGRRPAIGSPLNIKHVRMSDASLGVLLDVMSLFGLFGEYHILLTGETAGRSRENSEKSAFETAVPWLACGPRIARGTVIDGPLSLIDTAPTAAELMHLPQIPDWRGKPVKQVLLDAGSRNYERDVA